MLARYGLLESAFRIRRSARARRNRFLAEIGTWNTRRRTPIDPSTHRWVDVDSDRVLCRVERRATTASVRRTT